MDSRESRCYICTIISYRSYERSCIASVSSSRLISLVDWFYSISEVENLPPGCYCHLVLLETEIGN